MHLLDSKTAADLKSKLLGSWVFMYGPHFPEPEIWSRISAVLRAFASHKDGPDSIPDSTLAGWQRRRATATPALCSCAHVQETSELLDFST